MQSSEGRRGGGATEGDVVLGGCGMAGVKKSMPCHSTFLPRRASDSDDRRVNLGLTISKSSATRGEDFSGTWIRSPSSARSLL